MAFPFVYESRGYYFVPSDPFWKVWRDHPNSSTSVFDDRDGGSEFINKT